MPERSRPLALGTVTGALGHLAPAGSAGLAAVYACDVAVAEGHAFPTRPELDTTDRDPVERRGARVGPPHLTEAVTERSSGEVFRLLRHGVRMSGRPAFGPTHDDRTLRSIAAFVKDLPAVTPERYASLGDPVGGGERRGGAEGGGQGAGHRRRRRGSESWAGRTGASPR